MKKKILFIVVMVIALTCAFAMISSAAKYTVKYDGQSFTQETDENGVVTLRDTIFGNVNTAKTFFGWFTLKGDMYKPGEQVTITEDITLYQAYGYEGTNKSLPLGGDSQWDWPFIQLQEDLVLDYTMNPPWGGCATVDLNGHTITTSAKNAVEQTRGGIRFVGKGEIIHTGSGNFFNCASHGYGDGSQYLLIGKYVKVTTGGTLFNYTNWINSNIPVLIYGDVTCKQLVYLSEFGDNKTVNIDINPVSLTVTGDKFVTCGKYPDPAKSQIINVTIGGGVLKLSAAANTDSYWNNGNPSSYNIVVTGGAFTSGKDVLNTYISSEYAAYNVVLDGVEHTVVLKAGSCPHNYEQTASTNASCVVLATSTYTCSLCGESYTVSHGEYNEHTWILLKDTQPSSTSVGLREYECSVCKEPKVEKYFNDVADSIIKVKVNKNSQITEVSVRVGDVFQLESTGENIYKLTGLKDFSEYLVTDIVEIPIPLGIAEVNFTSNNSTLQKIVFEDGAITTVKSFSKYSAVTHIEIKSADVVFVKGCSNSVIQSIRSDKSGANVTFDSEAFGDKATLEVFTINAGSVYTLGNACFKHTGIKEFIVPDYTDITFKNEGAFYEGSLEYIYIGRGIKALNGKPFDRCKNLHTVVLMEVESFSAEWNFCVPSANDNITQLKVYIHSSTISLPNNTFYFRSGVTVYTNAPITNANAFSNCSNYTIVYGIPHEVHRGVVAPTCEEEGSNGYVTSCPCGEQLTENIIVKVFDTCLTNSGNYTEVLYGSTPIPATGHSEGAVLGIEYLNGFVSNGTKTCICKICDKTYTEEDPSAEPIIIFLGYSTNFENTELAIGFSVRLEALSTYEDITGNTISYGIIGAITDTLDGKAPMEADDAQMVKIALTRDYPTFNLKFKGFNDETASLGMTMCAYIIEKSTDEEGNETEELAYIQGVQSNAPSSYSISQYIEENQISIGA